MRAGRAGPPRRAARQRRHAARGSRRQLRPSARHQPEAGPPGRLRSALRRRHRTEPQDRAQHGADADPHLSGHQRHPDPSQTPAARVEPDPGGDASGGQLPDRSRGGQRQPRPGVRIRPGLRSLRRVLDRGARPPEPRGRTGPRQALHQRDAGDRPGNRASPAALRRSGAALLPLAPLHRTPRPVRSAAWRRGALLRRVFPGARPAGSDPRPPAPARSDDGRERAGRGLLQGTVRSRDP
jgi:hypothetical protein